MSDALPLPPRPHLDHYRKLARDLQHACRSGASPSVRAWATRWLETLGRLRAQGPTSTDGRREVEREAERVEDRWRRFLQWGSTSVAALPTLSSSWRASTDSRWPKFAAHIETLTRPGSAVSHFEAAAEAVIAGDAAELRRLLRAHPGLARARSSRDHHSTLLHYVSANGVKGTPLDWTLYAWAKAQGQERERGYEMVAVLIRQERGSRLARPSGLGTREWRRC